MFDVFIREKMRLAQQGSNGAATFRGTLVPVLELGAKAIGLDHRKMSTIDNGRITYRSLFSDTLGQFCSQW